MPAILKVSSYFSFFDGYILFLLALVIVIGFVFVLKPIFRFSSLPENKKRESRVERERGQKETTPYCSMGSHRVKRGRGWDQERKRCTKKIGGAATVEGMKKMDE